MKTLKKLNYLLAILGLTLVYAGCSDKSFTASDTSVRQNCIGEDPDKSCVRTCDDNGTCKKNFDYQVDAVTGQADILFVVDNSGSMSVEQRKMGERFPSFLNSILGMDYRIAVTTTDISDSDNPAAPKNQNGALQDGRLIQFPSGQYFLNGSYDVNDEQDMFLDTVQRQETINCEQDSTRASCPSGDERGILAAHMTLSNNPANFIRKDGHMAIVILSDEDERSDGNEPFLNVENPAQFANAFKQLYPKKSLKVHSIIIQPGNNNCWSQQQAGNNGQIFSGFFGHTYSELTDLTGGIQGNICANNYSNQLQEIGEDVAQPREILPCRPLNDDVSVTFIPEPSYPVEVTKNLSANEILFSEGLPKGTKIRFQFSCQE